MGASIKTLEFLIVRVCRAHHKLASQKFEKLGLFRGQPPVLFELDQQDGMTHGELAHEIGVTPATITTMVQRMEQSGFVARRRDAQDERVSRVYLTESGRAALAEAKALTVEMDEICFSSFDEIEKQQMRGMLERVLANLTGAQPG
jgi:DNA-binding MarR family transcriptional regulator